MERNKVNTPRRIAFSLVVSFACLIIVAGKTGANDQSKILLSLGDPIKKNACRVAIASCNDIVTSGLLYPRAYFAYVVVADGDPAEGISGLEFGVAYDGNERSGVDIFDWTRCSSMDWTTSNWPKPGSGAMLAWNDSDIQREEPAGVGKGVMAVAGYFYCTAYSPDALKLTSHPALGLAAVADGMGREIPITLSSSTAQLGSVSFSVDGKSKGFNPCGGGIGDFTTTLSSTSGEQGVVVLHESGQIRFETTLNTRTAINCKIFSITGSLIKEIVTQGQGKEIHSITWDLTDQGRRKVPSGMYLYTIQSSSESYVGKIVLAN